MTKLNKILSLSLTTIALFSMGTTAFANEEMRDPNLVISTQENFNIPNNVSMLSYDVTYDHNSDIVWNQGYRKVTGNTQAQQGSIKISSYTRARFESLPLRIPYGDSGRVWSEVEGGRSYAESDWELYSTLDSGVACTYYGIGVE